MNVGKYPPAPIVTLYGFIAFFLGISFIFQVYTLENIVSLFIIVLISVGISYRNRTPLGGLIFGMFSATVFILGFLVSICIWELSAATASNTEFTLTFLMDVLTFYGPGLLSAIIALASIGLFFGTLGYIFGHISMKVVVTQPRIFRDYWSNANLLGKSSQREYQNLDRKLGSWSFRKKGWWKKIVERLSEPPDNIVFSRSKTNSENTEKGELYDLSTGQMVGNDLIDPAHLISKYRPIVLKVAGASTNPEGIRRLAVERLLERFLRRLIPSRSIWIFYLILSAILIYVVNFYWTNNLAAYPYYETESYQIVLSGMIVSACTIFFVWRWRKISKELFEKRPDERVLILMVYIILALLFGFYFQVIVNPPGNLENWTSSWLVWTGWLSILTILLGFGYIFIHRESERVNTYFYANSPKLSRISSITPYRNTREEPFWLKEEPTEMYWVLRFMYFWRYELAKIPHPDWERVEIWIDAKKGTVKWIVSDYHYRELWYKVKGEISTIYIKFLLNFHTPVPVVDKTEVESITKMFSHETRDLLKLAISGRSQKILEQLNIMDRMTKVWRELHAAKWIQRYGLPTLASEFCSKLSWTYWRYPHGLEKMQRYIESLASRIEDQPPRQFKEN